MGLKKDQIQALAQAEAGPVAAAAAAAVDGGIRRSILRITHQGGGGDAELTSATGGQSFDLPDPTPLDGVFLAMRLSLTTPASGGGIGTMSPSVYYGPYGVYDGPPMDLANPGAFISTQAEINGGNDIAVANFPAYYGPGGTFDGVVVLFYVDGGPAQQVTFAAPTSETDLANQINAQTTGITASIFTGGSGEQLRVKSDTTGATSRIEMSEVIGGPFQGLTELNEGPVFGYAFGTDMAAQNAFLSTFGSQYGLAGARVGIKLSGDVPLAGVTAFDLTVEALFLMPGNAAEL